MSKYKIFFLGFFIALGYLLSLVFKGVIILPQSLHVGFLNLRFYGIFMSLAVLTSYGVATFRAKKFGIEKEIAEDLIFFSILGGFVGARLYHVVSSFDFYVRNVWQVFYVWQGGLSIYGAVLGGAIGLYLAKRKFNLNKTFTELLNWLAPSLLLGQIIGRFGNLFNYELYGYPTALPWKMFVPVSFRPVNYLTQSFFHPLFLYEQLGNLAILFFLLWLEKKPADSSPSNFFGALKNNLFLTGILLYNIMRFVLEFIRIDSPILLGFRQNAVVSLIVVFIVLFLLFLNVRKSKSLVT